MRKRVILEVDSLNPMVKEYIEGNILEEKGGKVLLEKLYIREKAPEGPYTMSSATLDPDEAKAFVVVQQEEGRAKAYYFADEDEARAFFSSGQLAAPTRGAARPQGPSAQL